MHAITVASEAIAAVNCLLMDYSICSCEYWAGYFVLFFFLALSVSDWKQHRQWFSIIYVTNAYLSML